MKLRDRVARKTAHTHRGFWWEYPSLLEPAAGPWLGMEIHNLSTVEAWKVILDWMAEQGADVFVTGLPGHSKHPTMIENSYHYLLACAPFPEAACFSGAFRERTANLVREILAHARQRGLRPFFHHYNNIAPRGLMEAHPELRSKWQRSRGTMIGHDEPEAYGLLVGNLCIFETVFQEFMEYCYAEVFRVLPDLDGILITPGEFNHCQCPRCSDAPKPGCKPNLYSGVISRPQNVNGVFECLSLFERSLRRVGKTAAARVWSVPEGSADRVPKSLIYVVKYAMFDCVRGALPDPLIGIWKGRGAGLWVTPDTDGENAGRKTWHDPAYFQDLARHLSELDGVTGVILHRNPWWGLAQMNTRVQTLNARTAAHCLRHPEKLATAELNRQRRALFGRAEPIVTEALRVVAESVLSLTGIFYLGGEGYTYGLPPSFGEGISPDPWWPVGEGRVPPDFVRQGIFPLCQLGERIRSEPWREGWIEESVPNGEKNPLDLLDQHARLARRMISRLRAARGQFEPSQMADYDMLVTSLMMCEAENRELYHLVMAKFRYWAAENALDSREKANHAISCLEHFDRVVLASERQWELHLDLPAGSILFHYYLRQRMPAYGSFAACLFWPLQWRRGEARTLRKHFQVVLDASRVRNLEEVHP